MSEREDQFRAFLEYDPDKFEGKKITSGNGRGQLPARFFNAIMRNNFSTIGLLHLHVTDDHSYIDAQKLATISSEELQWIVRQLGPTGAEEVRKALNGLLDSQE